MAQSLDRGPAAAQVRKGRTWRRSGIPMGAGGWSGFGPTATEPCFPRWTSRLTARSRLRSSAGGLATRSRSSWGLAWSHWCSPSSGLSDQRLAEVTEQDITDALRGDAATAHTLRCWVQEAGPVVERLAEDYPAAATLLQSLVVADARPLRLGTPRHLEEAALAILRDLGL